MEQGLEIRIHRRKRVVIVNGKPVRVTQEEYHLLVALGIMDNRLVPHDVLLDVMCDGRVQIEADKDVLMSTMYRLRKKIGADVLKNSRQQGYVLVGDVQFIG